MESLSGQSLSSAFTTCKMNPDVRIGIACRNRNSALNLLYAISEEIVAGKLVGWQLSHHNYFALEYAGNEPTSKSSIRIFDVQMLKQINGMSFHEILYEEPIDKDVFYILKARERLDASGIIFKNDEMDEFLSGFKIIERSVAT